MPKRYYSFMIDAALADGLKRLKARDGIPESEQIRRGVRDWLRRKGIDVKDEEPKGGRGHAKKTGR